MQWKSLPKLGAILNRWSFLFLEDFKSALPSIEDIENELRDKKQKRMRYEWVEENNVKRMLLSISIGYRDYAMFFLRRRAGWGDSCVYEEWKCHSTWSGCCILSFLKKTLVELFGTKFRTSGSEIQHNRKSKPVVWNLETTENRNQVTKSKIYFAKGCQHLCSAICTLSSRQSLASAEIAWMDCRI